MSLSRIGEIPEQICPPCFLACHAIAFDATCMFPKFVHAGQVIVWSLACKCERHPWIASKQPFSCWPVFDKKSCPILTSMPRMALSPNQAGTRPGPIPDLSSHCRREPSKSCRPSPGRAFQTSCGRLQGSPSAPKRASLRSMPMPCKNAHPINLMHSAPCVPRKNNTLHFFCMIHRQFFLSLPGL